MTPFPPSLNPGGCVTLLLWEQKTSYAGLFDGVDLAWDAFNFSSVGRASWRHARRPLAKGSPLNDHRIAVSGQPRQIVPPKEDRIGGADRRALETPIPHHIRRSILHKINKILK